MTTPLIPQPFNLAGLKAAWAQPRPDTWTHGGRDDRWRWQRDLARALATNDLTGLDALLANGATLEGPVVMARHKALSLSPGMSWMAQAVAQNNVPLMELLLTRGAPTDKADFSNKHPMMHYALRNDSLEAAQWLLDHGWTWEGVSSASLFDQVESSGKTTFSSPRCMQAWLGTWDRPWDRPDEPLAWATFAIVEDDADLLRRILARAPVEQWTDDQRDQLWATVIQFDRDERLGNLLDLNLVPTWDIPQNRTFDMGELGRHRELREPMNAETRAMNGDTPWWHLNEDVPTPWSWLLIRAGAHRIAERWLTVPGELARMRETMEQEPLVLLQRPNNNTVVQNPVPIEALDRLLDLDTVRDEHGNTPLHRWVGLAMETQPLLEWAASHHPGWGDVRNHAGQTVWAFADDAARGRHGQSVAARLHAARTTWDTAILTQAMDSMAPDQEARIRPRL